MVKTETLVKNYIYQLSINEDIDLEDYIKDIFSDINKAGLKKYCNENCIYYKSNFSKERLIQCIYGSCSSILGYSILSAKTIKNETTKDFYYRIYVNFIEKQ